MIFLLENFDLQRTDEPWKLFQRLGYVYNEREADKPQQHQNELFLLDYIQAFDKVLYYNNDKHKHTWFIKVLYKEWTKVSPDLNKLYYADHFCWLEKVDQIYFFIKFSIPWIHKRTPEIGFTEEDIPCLYRTYYNNFWDKLMKQDPKTKQLISQELLDFISEKIDEYNTIP
ncbi:hypothetical protein H5410_043183 [Solanum commersonii]|uniref:Uncharacterized protein n=1 Tax=Solanum commersonii TaxID=4109 RepID=A0A9J5XXR3_SOLCO|nr:hypothetical protein H5410_043183 [Solanum commersonii]